MIKTADVRLTHRLLCTDKNGQQYVSGTFRKGKRRITFRCFYPAPMGTLLGTKTGKDLHVVYRGGKLDWKIIRVEPT